MSGTTATPLKAEFASGIEKEEDALQLEKWMNVQSFKVSKRKVGGYYIFKVSVRNPEDLIRIGYKLHPLSPNLFA